MKIIPELTQKEIDRFWTKVDIKGEDDCWEWLASKVDDKYGKFGLTRNGKPIMYYSHRIALLLKTGTQESTSRHSCDNPGCCNPNHLIWGTQQDNMEDKSIRGRAWEPKGTLNHKAKLSENDIITIRSEFDLRSLNKKELSTRYGVSVVHITNIINRSRWSHI